MKETALNRHSLKILKNKYLGSWGDKIRDINVRKALAWRSLHKLKSIWKSSLKRELKILLFRATTESILLYGCGTWSLTKQEEKSLDGTYTRMLRMVLNVGWNEHVTNTILYGSLKKVTDTIRTRRLQLAGHVFRDKSSPACHTVTWKPRHGIPSDREDSQQHSSTRYCETPVWRMLTI